MTPTGWRAWVPVTISIVAVVASVTVACWQASERRGVSYAATMERIATVEVRVDDLEADIPQSLKIVQDNQAAVAGEVNSLRADLTATRAIAASTGYRADEAFRESQLTRKAIEEIRQMLLEEWRARARDRRDDNEGG